MIEVAILLISLIALEVILKKNTFFISLLADKVPKNTNMEKQSTKNSQSYQFWQIIR